ncbi:MAG: GTA-gp10 family protein [Novosphingobium meiothermophilum]
MSEENEVRGEIALDLGGREFVLRPTYQAIQAIESKTGKGILALARGTTELTVLDAAIIAAECIKAHGKHIGDEMMASYTPVKLGEMIFETEGGVGACLGRLSVLLMLAATGGYTASGELKAAKDQATA